MHHFPSKAIQLEPGQGLLEPLLQSFKIKMFLIPDSIRKDSIQKDSDSERIRIGYLEKFLLRKDEALELPREVMEFKNHGNVALRDMASGHCGDGLTVVLGDLSGLFQP